MSGYVAKPGPWTAAVAIVVPLSLAIANYVGSPLLVAGTLLTLLFVGVAYRAYRQTV
jgi:hypothetical protein